MVLLRARVFARGGSHGEFRPRSRAGLVRATRAAVICAAILSKIATRRGLRGRAGLSKASGYTAIRRRRDRARKSSLELLS